MKKTLLFLFPFFAGFSLAAQQVRPMSSSDIYQKLEQLNTLGTVMYLAAHPDDENTRLISYLVHHDHVRTIYYSLTRGDGGQNILGQEQGAALGLIRTHELMEARKIDGAEQLFSPAIDFGFTKSPEETFRFWDKKELVQRVVAAIQQYKPDIIICRFPTTGEGGHGQHTASAIVAGEAYAYIRKYNDTAAQKLWLPRRLLFNAFRFGSANTIRPGQFRLAINQYDPLLGEGYGEMAGRSRSAHKSQGAGTPQVAGISDEYFQLIAGDPLHTSLYDNIDLSWNRIRQDSIGKEIREVIHNFRFTRPSASIPALISIRKKIERLTDTFWKAQKLQETDNLIFSCAGIMAEALTDRPEAVPGSNVEVHLNIIARGQAQVTMEHAEAPRLEILKGSVTPATLQPDSMYSYPYTVTLNKTEPLTEPYWMAQEPVNNLFRYDPAYGGVPEATNHLNITITVTISGQALQLSVPLSYKKLDPVRGDVTQRLRIVPAVSIEPDNSLFIYKPGTTGMASLHLKIYQHITGATLDIFASHEKIASMPLPALKEGLDTFISVSIPTERLSGKNSTDILSFSVEADGISYTKGLHLITYPHIPELQYFTEARMKAIPESWQTAVKKVGYIEGVGDYVDDILSLCGLTIGKVPLSALNNIAYLKQYDAIIIGIRALNTQKELASGMGDLLQYVAGGGTLLIQYNNNQHLVTPEIGPYPITLSRDRVTEEDAAVRFTNPRSKLLHFPNEITGQDFEGWVQERGLYFPSAWDPHYQTLLAMHDTGEKDLKGAVLYTPYGKGQFIYTSLAFFRQLPAGNAGAIRLFMNLLSAGK